MTYTHEPSTDKAPFDQALTRIFAGLENIAPGSTTPARMKGSGKTNTNLRRDQEMPSRHPGDNPTGRLGANATGLTQAETPLGELVVRLRNGFAERRIEAERELLREAETIVLKLRIAHALSTIR